MAGVAVLGSLIKGMTSGEHNGHITPHPPCEITGKIVGKCSSFVSVNEVPIALVGSTTEEEDCCCSGKMSGEVKTGSSFVTVGGIPVARIGDDIQPHNGTAKITTGSSFVVEVGD